MLHAISQVLDTAVVFKPKGERKEEIAIVVKLGDIVIIGEAKCALLPAEAKQRAMDRKTVTDAIAQTSRKTSAVFRHREEFRTKF